MPTRILFETHSITEDNESGHATGWLPGRLSETGRELARELGERRRDDGIAAVFTSDLARAVETARIAFDGTGLPILADWRLRECDYGTGNGRSRAELQFEAHLDTPFPGGESWRQAVSRVSRFLPDLALRWADARVCVIGHAATRWAFEHVLGGIPLEDLLAETFVWRDGWEYALR